jgi:predicted GIY-YIG superfamily endonuclease
MFYTYILQSEVDNSLYTGYTALEPLARLKKHNTGEVVYTSKKKPWKLIWYCAFTNEKKAIAFEKYLKIGSGFAFARKHLI